MASRCANPRAGDAGAAEVDQLGQQITRHITHRHPRRQHLVQHLHAAGPRPVFEAMLEPDAGRDLDSVLERYAEIPIGIYHTVGADALPIETITGGGRGAGVMSRRRQPEAQIQRAIVQHYRARAADGVFMFAVPNGGFRRPIEAAILKATGTVAGMPDTIWVKGGQVYALELKTAGGKPTEAQLATIAKMEAAGAFCCTADGLDRALAVLEAWGLLQGRAS